MQDGIQAIDRILWQCWSLKAFPENDFALLWGKFRVFDLSRFIEAADCLYIN